MGGIDTPSADGAAGALTRAESELEALIRSSNDAFVRIDAQGIVTAWNAVAEELFGWSADEAIGRPLGDTIIPAQHHWAHVRGLENFHRAGEGQVFRRLMLPARTRSGDELPIELTVWPVPGSGERPGFAAFLRDARDQALARERELALEESERRLRATFASAAVGMALLDHDGRIVACNGALGAFLGRDEADIVGGELNAWAHDADRAHLSQLGDELLAFDRDEYTLELRYVRSDGDTVWARQTSSMVYDASEQLSLCVVQDVTDQKRAEAERDRLEAELRMAHKLEAVGSLAAGIAHEINTPAQFVGDSLHFLQEGSRDVRRLLDLYRELVADVGVPESDLAAVRALEQEIDLTYLDRRMPSAFERTFDGVERISTIVRAMKAFSHPDQAEMSLADINEALSNSLVVARNEYRYCAEPVLELGDLPQVFCFIGELNQVFLNLIVNAAHAIEDANTARGDGALGTITVRTRRDGGDVVIEVADTGSGIPDEVRGRIFDPFFTTKDVGRGSGQGLALARATVVDRHGGSLRFDTEIGVGTTFEVRIPIEGAGMAGGRLAA